MTNEQWKNIEGYDGSYQVSNTGRIKSLARIREGGIGTLKERILKTTIGGRGYPLVSLEGTDAKKTFFVHRLVAITFLGNQPNMQVHHRNANKLDARLENLQWVTPNSNYDAKLRHHNMGKYNARKHPIDYMI